MMHATLNDWIRHDAIRVSLDSSESFNAAVDRVVAALGESVELLGFGEALHGGEEILALRNRLFERLVAAHGYSAIAIESSFTQARFANKYVSARGPLGAASYEDVKDRGFSHGFGHVEANRELIEWMRLYNADPPGQVPLRFYGFDIPGIDGYASPSGVLRFAIEYLCSIDPAGGREHRERIESLLGDDAQWENPAAYTDLAKAMGLSPSAAALRVATEDLLAALRTGRPECVARIGRDAYAEAVQHVVVARELLNSHAGLARGAGYAALLGIRDALMADNLAYVVDRERGRGKVLAFAHNSHLQRGKVDFPVLGQWWPAGSHLHEMFGPRYGVIGSAVGLSEANGITPPEADSLEARLAASAGAGAMLFIPTYDGAGLPAAEIAALPVRARSAKNPSYAPLGPQSLADF